MALNELTQIKEMLKGKQNILIAFKKNYHADSLVSALALARILHESDRQVTVACQDFKVKPTLRFLHEVEIVQAGLSGQGPDLHILIKEQGKKVGEISYDKQADGLNIIIKPQDKSLGFKPADIMVQNSVQPFDLIFVLDSADLDSLGELYTQHKQLFFQAPIINIDHGAQNEKFGPINYIDTLACSTAEMIYELGQSLAKQKINKETSTYLLTGIMAKTKAFTSLSVSPKAFNISSQLMGFGAQRDYIVKNLFQTKSLPALKLWGRALARLKKKAKIKIIWTVLTKEDFAYSQADEDDLPDIIEDLLGQVPESEIIVVLYQNPAQQIKALINAQKSLDALYLSRKFKPQGDKDVAMIDLPMSELSAAEKTLMQELIKQRTE